MATTHGSGRRKLQIIAHEAMLQRGLLPDFSPAVIAETNRIDRGRASLRAGGSRICAVCFGHRSTTTISEDLDQLSVAESAPGGAVKILVAIADVDALVKKGSAIDDYARTNTTSVYTAAEMFPMLPVRLSTNLTSLNEGQERLAIVVEMVLADDGTVTASDIYQAMVLSRAKLAYNGIAAWLEGRAPAPPKLAAVPGLDEQLRIQDRAAQRLRWMRQARGALRLETTQVKAVFDDGSLADLLPDEKNRAKQLIEDFMIAANGVTAQYLEKKRFPSLRRVLSTPKRWDRIVALAAEFGGQLPLEPDSARWICSSRSACIPTQRDFRTFRSLSSSCRLGRVRARRARPTRTGAFRAGGERLHALHRAEPAVSRPHHPASVEGGARGQASPYTNDELAGLARHCTSRRTTPQRWNGRFEVRRGAAPLARIGARFNAIVTGASAKGTWVRISGPTTEGRLVDGFEGLDVGDRLGVRLVRTDMERGFIDFAADRSKR